MKIHKRLTFKKGERLKSRKVIGQLFKSGKSIGAFPLRLFWIKVDTPRSMYPIQFALSIPKRKFAKAVDRNALKRKVREAYRLHKSEFYAALEGEEGQVAFMVIYIAKEAQPSQQIHRAMRKLARKFGEEWKKSTLQTNG